AERAPDAVAVAWDEGALTYGELHFRAEVLAQDLGVAPGARVALCRERSPELMIALLGVLQAGATVVPLDPRYPAERLRFMLEDSGASLLRTDTDEHGRAQTNTDQPGRPELACRPCPVRARPCSSVFVRVTSVSDLAYVLYTRGYTRQPTHLALARAALANH